MILGTMATKLPNWGSSTEKEKEKEKEKRCKLGEVSNRWCMNKRIRKGQ